MDNTTFADARLHGIQADSAQGVRSTRRVVAEWTQAVATWLHERAQRRLSIREYRRLRVENSEASWAACFEFDPRVDDMLHRTDD